MSFFRMQFHLEDQNRYLLITALEDHVFAVHFENEDRDDASPEAPRGQVPQAPDLLLQRTRTGNWTMLKEGPITLSAEDLKRLGRRIEAELPYSV